MILRSALPLLALAASLHAADGISGVCARNPAGALIAAHASDDDPDTNFHLIQGEASGKPGTAGNYRAIFSLKSASGAAIPLLDDDGNPVSSLISPTAPLINAAGTVTLRLGFATADPLDRNALYRVAATVQRQTSATTWTNVGSSNGPLQHFITFSNSPGDPSLNTFATSESINLNRSVIVRSNPGDEEFSVSGSLDLIRLDETDADPASATIPLTFTLSLENSAGTSIPLAAATTTLDVDAPSHVGGLPAVTTVPFTLRFAPADWNELLPTQGYQLKVSVAHADPDGTTVDDFSNQPVTAPSSRLFAFTGDIFFGSTRARFSAVSGDPSTGGINLPGNVLESSLTIPAGNGTLAGNDATSRRFGGSPMEVWIEPGPTGQLVFFRGLGQVAFNTTDTDLTTLGGLRVIRTTMRLTQNGLSADAFGVFLPDGFGYSRSATGRRLRSIHEFTNLPCGPDLLPASSVLTISGPGTIHAVHDSLPLRFSAPEISWDLTAGTFTIRSGAPATYVRAAEDATFATPPLSNDAYCRAARELLADMVITTSPEGRAIIQSAAIGFSDGSFRAHFPQQAEISWDGRGQLVINEGRISLRDSLLEAPRQLSALYQRGCPKDPCGLNEPTFVTVSPSENSLRFTADGGLKLNGTLDTPEELRWGKNGPATYAHRTQGFGETRFHMPGNILRASENDRALLPGQEPAALLFTGMGSPDDESLAERPGTPPQGQPDLYNRGNADYAGLNFRRSSQNAWSFLGGGEIGNPANPYPLHPAAKYYARFGGVSGRHQSPRAAPNAPSAFSTVFLYGFRCNLSGIALGYLDNLNVFSAVGGGLHVPGDLPGSNGNPAPPPGVVIEALPPGMNRGPAAFDQRFASLTFHCDGRPDKAELDGTAPHRLEYWNVWFQPLTFAFSSKTTPGPGGIPCPIPGTGGLSLGSSVFIPSISSVRPQAVFTFKPNGNLVTRAEAASYGTEDASLTIPPEIPVNGPGNVAYRLATRGKAYLNNPAAPNAPTGPGDGWINLFGALDVPFFRDLKVQLHVANPSSPDNPATANPDASSHIMGGWSSHDALASPYAWTESGRTPFNHDAFDATQAGFTGQLAAYRNPTPAADPNLTHFLPRAQQEWLEVFRMDYAVRFNSSTLAFTGEGEPAGDLLVLKAKHRLLNLTSSIAEITFGASYEGLPVLNVTKVLNDAISGAAAGAFNQLASAGMDATGLTNAVNSIDKLLATGISDLIEAQLGAAIDNVTASIPIPDVESWRASPAAAIDISPFSDAIARLASAPTGAIDSAGLFVQEIDSRLADIDRGLASILAFLPSEAQIASGQGPIRNLSVSLLNQAIGGNPIGDAISANLSTIIAEGIEPELKRAGPALAEVRSSVLKVRAAIQKARDSLQSGSGLLREIQSALSMGTSFANSVRDDLKSWAVSTPGTLTERGPAWIRTEIRRLILRRFYADSAAAKLQGALRYHFTSVRQAFRGAIDGLLGEVNRTIRDGVSSALKSLDDELGLSQFSAGLGQASESLGAAAVEGYARIAGDSIDKLRIDARLRLRAADDFEFKGWLEVNALNAKSPRAKCYCDNPSEMRDGAEIIIGGEAPITFMSEGTGKDEDNARIRVQGMFAFGACGPPGTPISLLGLGGQLEMTGEINVAGVTIREIGFIFSFGKASNYFGAKARASFKGYEFAAALFVGSTCGAEPLRFVDPSIATLLTHPKVGVLKSAAEIDSTRITGFYVYAEAWIPLNEIFGIPTTCLFSVRAGVGAGPFVFAVDVPGPQSQLMVGSKQFLGFDVDLLCIASATAEVRLTGAVTIPFNDPVNSSPDVLENKPAGESYGTSAEGLALRLLGEASFTIEICLLVCVEFTKDFDFYAQVGGNNTSFGFGH